LALQSIEPFFSGGVREAVELLDHAARLASPASSARRRSWIAGLRARANAAGLEGRPTALAKVEWVALAGVPKLAACGRIPDGPSLMALSYYLGMHMQTDH
jgi:hypothetical protein